jgi:hypothetical protein
VIIVFIWDEKTLLVRAEQSLQVQDRELSSKRNSAVNFQETGGGGGGERLHFKESHKL